MRSDNKKPIGVFDSGVGGLTVLKELYRQLPNESILYYGDTARVPYGTRNPDEIIQFSFEILDWMVSQGVKMVIMACNTSSALALERVRANYDIPILGVLLPGARAAIHAGRNIGVIATPATIASNAYRRAILEIDGLANVIQIACPEFVPLIEQGRIYDDHTLSLIQFYFGPLLEQGIDTLVYGCTHYPLLDPVIANCLPDYVVRIDPAIHVVASAACELDMLGLRNTCSCPITRFMVSGCPEQFQKVSIQWLGNSPMVEKINLLMTSKSHEVFSRFESY